jgi:hypothetical protein
LQYVIWAKAYVNGANPANVVCQTLASGGPGGQVADLNEFFVTTGQNFGMASNLVYDFGTATGTVQLICQLSAGNALTFSARITAIKVANITSS